MYAYMCVCVSLSGQILGRMMLLLGIALHSMLGVSWNLVNHGGCRGGKKVWDRFGLSVWDTCPKRTSPKMTTNQAGMMSRSLPQLFKACPDSCSLSLSLLNDFQQDYVYINVHMRVYVHVSVCSDGFRMRVPTPTTKSDRSCVLTGAFETDSVARP